MTTSHEAWAAVVGCPAEALSGRYQLRPTRLEDGANGHLLDGSAGVIIVDTSQLTGFDDFTRSALGLEHTSLAIGVEAVRQLNLGYTMPLDLDWIHEDVLADEMHQEDS